MKRSAKLRLILADDHSVLREGLSLIFNALPDLAVVAQASTGEEAFQLFLEHEPDVLILDPQRPGEGGISTIKRLLKERPGAKILVLTAYDMDEEIYRSMHAGANGLLAPPDSPISPRRMAAHHRQYVDSLDFRRQRGRPDGPVAVYALLSDLWDRRGSDAYSYPTGRDCSNCRCLRRDRGRVRRVFVTIPDRTAGGDVSRALCAILL